MESKTVALPLLSIVIATRNRIPYAISAIKSILEIPDPRLELVVQDNSDSLDLKSYVHKNIKDNRFSYRYTPPPFSSIDNFNAAMEMATGEYVCLIGDDDGICPQIFEVVCWAKKNNIESISPKTFCEYIWPNSFGNNKDSILIVPKATGQIIGCDPAKQLTVFFKQGALDYLWIGFPKIYHGIVKKECLERIKSKTGFYFGGLSPDIYAAIALACIVNRHIIIDFPLTIAGACNQSTTIDSKKGKHSGNLRSAPHFRDRGNYIWDNLIPKVYSIETIWAESALKALADMERNDLRLIFNADLFLVKNILRNTDNFKYFISETFKYLKVNKKSVQKFFKLTTMLFYIKFRYLLHLLASFMLARKSSEENMTFTDVMNIEAATILATKVLNEKKIVYKF